MDIEDAIYQFYDRDAKKLARGKDVLQAAIPSAVRTLRYKELRQNGKERANIYTPAGQKLTPSEMRIRALMAADRQAQKQQRRAENESKREVLLKSKEPQSSPAKIKEIPGSTNFVRPPRDQHHLHLSPQQRAAGYVARYTPDQSAIAAGSMGAVANGAKEQGITAFFNAALNVGRNKTRKAINAGRQRIWNRFTSELAAESSTPNKAPKDSLRLSRDFAGRTKEKSEPGTVTAIRDHSGSAARTRTKVAETQRPYKAAAASKPLSALKSLLDRKQMQKPYDAEKRREDERGDR